MMTVNGDVDGVDLISDTVDVATKLGLIDNSTQGYFKLLDIDTGEVLKNEDGTEVKIRGKKNIKPYFKEHIDIFKKLYDRVYEEIAKVGDNHLITFESLMNNKESTVDIDFSNTEDM